MAKQRKKPKLMTQQALTTKGKKLGFDAGVITTLVSTFGPYLVQFLLKWWEKKNKDAKLKYTGPGPMTAGFADFLFKNFITDFLVNSRDQILDWIDDGEEAVYDAVMAIVAKRSDFLADILAKYKKTIIALDDKISAAMLDRLIDALRNQ